MKKKLEIDPNKPPKMWWLVKDVFPDIQHNGGMTVGAFVNALSLPETRRSVQAAYGYILMACVEEQTKFLCAVWEQFYPDRAVILGLRTLIDLGRLPEVLAPTPEARRLVTLAAAVAQRTLDDVNQSDMEKA